MHILFLGDVVGRTGREAVADALPKLRSALAIDLAVVNAENASHGFGLAPEMARDLFAAGADAITLETGLGPVRVELSATDTDAVFGRMTQPHPTLEPFADAPALLAALHLERSEIPLTEIYVNGPRNAYVALRSEDAVTALAPDMQALRAVGMLNVSCFTVTGMRVKTRVFAPSLGVPEDPATGSAAGPLALHLARHGAIAWGQEIEISQGAEINRPSRLYACVTGNADAIERIEVAGAAVVVARGSFEV